MPEGGFAPSQSMRAVLWIARIVSVIIVVFLVFMVVGYTVNPQGSGSGPNMPEWFGLALFPFGLCIGYVIGWRWQLLGGAVSLICLVAFLVLMRELDMILILSVVGIPAVLYIVYGIHRRQMVSGDALTGGTER